MNFFRIAIILQMALYSFLPTKAQSSKILFGDFDNDGQITIGDITAMTKIILGVESPKEVYIQDGLIKVAIPGSDVVSGTEQGHDYVDLGMKNQNGHSVLWATCNVGGCNPTDHGLYYTWTEAVSSPWGNCWRMPTEEEILWLRDHCIWEWDYFQKGYNIIGENGNIMFLPVGKKTTDSVIYESGYWSSSLIGEDPDMAYSFHLTPSDIGVEPEDLQHELFVRLVCVIDEKNHTEDNNANDDTDDPNNEGDSTNEDGDNDNTSTEPGDTPSDEEADDGPSEKDDADEEGSSTGEDDNNDISYEKFPIRVGTWNVGHWSMGKSMTSTITSAQAETQKEAYERVFASISEDGMPFPDIMGINEYSDNFVKDGRISTDDFLFEDMPVKIKGEQNGFCYNCLFLRDNYIKESGIIYANLPAGEPKRYITWAICDIADHDVFVLVTHAPTKSSTQYKTEDDIYTKIRKPFFDQVAELISQHEYVIALGDWNENPGYIVRPDYTDYLGFFHHGFGWEQEYAYPYEGSTQGECKNLGLTYAFGQLNEGGMSVQFHVDNIMVKGFEMRDIVVSNTDYTLSDHICVGCTLEFKYNKKK